MRGGYAGRKLSALATCQALCHSWRRPIFDQLSRCQPFIGTIERSDRARRRSPVDVLRTQLGRMIEACGGDELHQRGDGVAMKVRNAGGLVVHIECTLPHRVLGCDSTGTMIGMALQRLQAAEREHESAGASCTSRRPLP